MSFFFASFLIRKQDRHNVRICLKLIIIIIIIIIMSLFYEDNIFSTSTNLTYGPRWKKYQTEQYHTIYTLYT